MTDSVVTHKTLFKQLLAIISEEDDDEVVAQACDEILPNVDEATLKQLISQIDHLLGDTIGKAALEEHAISEYGVMIGMTCKQVYNIAGLSGLRRCIYDEWRVRDLKPPKVENRNEHHTPRHVPQRKSVTERILSRGWF
jgi:hypothetical protein